MRVKDIIQHCKKFPKKGALVLAELKKLEQPVPVKKAKAKATG